MTTTIISQHKSHVQFLFVLRHFYPFIFSLSLSRSLSIVPFLFYEILFWQFCKRRNRMCCIAKAAKHQIRSKYADAFRWWLRFVLLRTPAQHTHQHTHKHNMANTISVSLSAPKEHLSAPRETLTAFVYFDKDSRKMQFNEEMSVVSNSCFFLFTLSHSARSSCPRLMLMHMKRKWMRHWHLIDQTLHKRHDILMVVWKNWIKWRCGKWNVRYKISTSFIRYSFTLAMTQSNHCHTLPFKCNDFLTPTVNTANHQLKRSHTQNLSHCGDISKTVPKWKRTDSSLYSVICVWNLWSYWTRSDSFELISTFQAF